MNAIALLVAATTLGVDYGWQPTEDGDVEYIIQIEPSLLEALKSGRDITSEIHPDVRGVRRFRIRVGSNALPREGSVASDDESQPAPGAPPAVEEPMLDTRPPQNPPFVSPFAHPGDNRTKPGGGEFPGAEPPPAKDDDGQLLPLPPASTPPRGGDFGSDASSDNKPPELQAPEPLQLDPDTGPLVHKPAVYAEDATGTVSAAKQSTKTDAPGDANASTSSGEQAEEAKPWFPLTLTALFLFGSVGLNLYLVWIARGIYVRYRTVSDELREIRAATA